MWCLTWCLFMAIDRWQPWFHSGLIFLGGGWGSISRYWLGRAINQRMGPTLDGMVGLGGGIFPWGTLGVNSLGCFVIGLVLALAERHGMSREQTLLLATGFCGGFTTFSSFAYESQSLGTDRQLGLALLYSLGSVVLGVVATGLGLWFGRR
ncbi:MAG: fluoride efflux transporter CrcB [Prochlorothrix sp.]|nr:fluoride efflux transporter CrcB [Prochlorothrix sp.]